MSETTNAQREPGVKGMIMAALASVREDYRSGGPKALLRNRTCQIAGGIIAAWFVLGALGGSSDELKVKGLYLDMPAEDAARVMLGHGFPPGGDAEFVLESLTTGTDAAKKAYEQARKEYTIGCVKAFAAEHKTVAPMDYLDAVLRPGDIRAIRDEVEAGMRQCSLERPEEFVDTAYKWFPWLVPPDKPFTPFKEFVAKNYPDGLPYEIGGPWHGTEPLEITGTGDERVLERHGAGGWEMRCDASDKVTAIKLSPPVVAKIFGAADMDAEEFARSFMASYGLPVMDAKTEAVDPIVAKFTGEFLRNSWGYVDRDHGWAVAISQYKQLELKRVGKGSFD